MKNSDFAKFGLNEFRLSLQLMKRLTSYLAIKQQNTTTCLQNQPWKTLY